MAFRSQPNARQGPYQQRAPPQPNPQFGTCAGCGGGRTLWQPKSGGRAGRSFIVCCRPYEERQGACQTLEEINAANGQPVAPQYPLQDAQYASITITNPNYQSQESHASAIPAPPLHPQAPDFVSALHVWCEQNQEMITHLAENVRLLTATVEEIKGLLVQK